MRKTGGVTLKMLFLMLITVGAFYYVPLVMNIYSPLPAMMAPWSDQVFVEGRIMYANETPAVGIEVTVFGTDELKTDVVMTDHGGHFISSVTFDTGQVITVSVNGTRLWGGPGVPAPFVDYDARDEWGPFDLGTFILPEG